MIFFFKTESNNRTLMRISGRVFMCGPTLLLLTMLLLMGSCRTFLGEGGSETPIGGVGKFERGPAELTRVQEKLVEGALYMEGKQKLRVNGRSFNMDCTGAVLAVYWYAGMDLAAPLARYQGNGVTRLYRFLEDEKLLHETSYPEAGDIIFWDNTYDRNGDKKPNDFLTHTGIVVFVAEDGTIEFLHHNYRKGVVMARMNLLRPKVYTEKKNGREYVVNSPMRMRGSPDYDRWLASELTRNFGRAWMAF